MKLGEKLKELRYQKRMTQAAVAEAIGVSRRCYVGYEQEGRYPRDRSIYDKMAELFGCDRNYLLQEDEEFVASSAELFGSRGKREAEELVTELAGMMAGGELSEEDQIAVLTTLQQTYLDCKKDNKKYTPKKYLHDS